MENTNDTTPTMSGVVPEVQVSNETQNQGMQTPHKGGYPRMAGFWRRFGAHFVDGLIISVVTGPFSGGGYNFNTSNIKNFEDLGQAMATMGPAISLANMLGWIVFFAAAYFYYGWFYSKKGQTPGKMLFKLKVVKTDLTLLDWNEGFIRDGLMKLVSGFAMALGYFWYFANPKRQTWHDSVVHSYVVQTDDNGQIFMDGQENYPVSKLKAIGFPCGCCLLWVLLFAGIVILAATMIPEMEKLGKNNPDLREAAQQYQQMQEEGQTMNEQKFDQVFDELDGELPESTPESEDVYENY